MSENQTDDRPTKPAVAQHKQGHDVSGAVPGSASAQERDPVCGMKIDPATSQHRFEHGGKTFHFCSAGCRTKFAAAPETYLKSKAAAPVKAGAVYSNQGWATRRWVCRRD